MFGLNNVMCLDAWVLMPGWGTMLPSEALGLCFSAALEAFSAGCVGERMNVNIATLVNVRT